MSDPLGRIVECRSVEDVWSVLAAEMASFGFDRLIYGYTRFRTPNGLGSQDDMLILTNHSDAYIKGFFADGMFEDAPMTEWASRNEGAMSWSYLMRDDTQITDKHRKIIVFNRRHGVTAGVTISFPDSSIRHKGAMALTARKGLSQTDADAIWDARGETINLLAQVAHLRIMSLPFPETSQRLSKRQREVLEWVGDGKTIQDIATIMGLKSTTVEKHLRKAREALNVETTTQAVMKASLHRQIFVLDR